MALGLTPEHLELAAAVRAWSSRHCPPDVVRSAAEAADHGASHYPEIRADLARLGLFGLHLAEADGGQGFGLPELAVAVEELGRALVPGAFAPTVLTSAVLAASDPHSALTAKLTDGTLAGTVCLTGGLTGERRGDGGLTVSGEVRPVLAGGLADLIVVPVLTAEPDGGSISRPGTSE